jgi:RHS repeat-associated protein
MENFFTQAFNFGSVAGGVDPRTGLFNLDFPLANLVGNDNLGPSLALSLAYSPLGGDYPGLGRGCMLNLSQYDSQAKLLTLASGERYKVVETESKVILQQNKLDSLRFEKVVSGPFQGHYKITHKSGDVELLRNDAYAVKVPVSLYSPTGRRLSLTWEASGSTRRLVQVADEANTLLRATYSDSLSTVTVWPDRSESYQVKLVLRGGYLTRLEQVGQDPVMAWDLEYSQVGASQMLTKVSGPTGLIEQVTYQANGHKFPDRARQAPLPYVTRYIQYPQGGQPSITKNYQYSSTNYLGYGVDGAWNPNSDFLYGILTDYTYWARETGDLDGLQVVTQWTYNNFHLTVQEAVTRGRCAHTTQTEYYARVGIPFDQQPPQFQLPRKVTETYQETGAGGSARSEVTEMEFDASGNPIRRLTPDGTETQWTYYPPAGEAGRCPAEPNGFTRLMSSETVTPPMVAGLTVPVGVTRHQYGGLSVVAGTPVTSAVVKSRQESLRDGRLLQRTDLTYAGNAASSDLGRILSLTNTLFTPDNPSAAYASRQDFTFRTDGERLIQTTVFTAYDKLTSTSQRTQSRFSGRVLSVIDPSGNETRYTYDKLGRILSETVCPDTGFAHTTRYEYGLRSGDQSTSSTLVVDPRGNQTRYWADALGRALRAERRDADGSLPGWLTVSAHEYDAWGRLRQTTSSDVLRPDGRVVSTRRTLAYDNWGQNSLTTFSDGHQERKVYDPVTLTAEAQIVGPLQGKIVTLYNLQNLPLEITRYDHAGGAQGRVSHSYDGLGRLRTLTDELGRSTSYSYDAWDRVTTVTLPDDTLIRKHYAPQSSGALLVGIEVDGVALGAQSFDGLERLVQTRSGSRSHQYIYEASAPVPVVRRNPDGREVRFAYQRELDYALTDVQADGVAQSFRYDPVTGTLTRATDGSGASQEMGDYPSGLLRNEIFSFDNGITQRRNQSAYSLNGRLQSCTGIDGIVRENGYDSFGRVTTVMDPDLSAAVEYDAVGRVAGWTVTDRGSGRSLGTRLTYDDFGREIRRDFSGGDSLAIAQDYELNGQIRSRTTRRDGVVLRDERFRYDVRNRLSEYWCDGTERPVDAYGKTVEHQSFAYDALGNITECVTSFPGGSDTAHFRYATDNPAQLDSVTHTDAAYPSRIDLVYDANGHLLRDEAGRELGYDALGRLISVAGGGGPGGTYRYDGLDRLVQQVVKTGDVRDLYYEAGVLANEVANGQVSTRFFRLGGGCVAQRRDGTAGGTVLIGCDRQNSVLTACDGGGRQGYAYTPYGTRSGGSGSVLGFNGERLDPVSGTYHLGNGYRAYNPILMRFNTPDSWSPFGAGGINPYAYCLGDPINRCDPSGHLSWQAWLGIGLGILGVLATAVTFGMAAAPVIAAEGVVAGLTAGASAVGVIGGLGVVADVTSIASGALEDVNPQASAILGWVSLGFGAPGAVAGAAGAARTIGRKVSSGLAKLSERVSIIRSEGLSGRGAMRAARAMGSRTPEEIAFEGRQTIAQPRTRDEPGFTSPRTDFNPQGGENPVSSYPHLTEPPERAPASTRETHITSARNITQVRGEDGREFDILERFSQDNRVGADALHDRFMAVDPDGYVHNASAKLDGSVHQSKYAKVPTRGMSLTESGKQKLTFTVGARDSKHPPISPRSARRKLPDTGYR